MKSSKSSVSALMIRGASLILLSAGLAACDTQSSTSTPPPPANGPTNGVTLPPMSGKNVLSLTVNGSMCSSNSYINKPCASITLCGVGAASSVCQTISDLLVDTGSYGLRVFKSALNQNVLSSLKPVSSGSGTLAECVQFADGSSDWGEVEAANIVLGSEPAVQVPIQVLDAGFSNASQYCRGADTGPAQAGFNGILGVGLFTQDCGTNCVGNSGNGLYFSCSGASCAGTAVPLANQVMNPVAALPTDNNGVIIELPSVPPGGVLSANGYLVLGIGTESNNQPTGVQRYEANASTGEFSTQFNGKTMSSFIDSGSNGLFFGSAPSSLSDCGSLNPAEAGWYCPSSSQSLTATTIGTLGSSNSPVSFQIGNFSNLLSSNNGVYAEIGGAAASMFDWGLPFYLGRNVFVGIEGTASSLGTGPYWGY